MLAGLLGKRAKLHEELRSIEKQVLNNVMILFVGFIDYVLFIE